MDIIQFKKVRQSNHLVESPYTQEFTTHEIKLFEIAVAGITNDDIQRANQQSNKRYSLNSKQLAKFLHTSVAVISMEIENIAQRIMKKSIHLRNILDDGSVEFKMINIIPYAEYRNGKLDFDLNYAVIPYLVEINKNFTEYQLHYLLSMKSSYAVKLYKLLYQYKNIKSRIFEVDELKNQFGIKDKYPQYKDFRKNVIHPSILQINKATDLAVSYTEFKIGRKIEKIEFQFSANILLKSDIKQTNMLENKSDLIVNNIEIIDLNKTNNLNQLVTLPLDDISRTISTKISPTTKQILNTFYKDKGEQYILASIEYAEENAKTNFDKYLQDTLKNGWCIAKLNKIQQKAEQETKNIQLEQKKQAKQEEQAIQRNIKQAKIKEDFLNLPIEERTESFSELITQISKAAPDKINEIVTNQEAYTIAYWAIKNKINYNGTLQLSLKVWLKLQ